MVSKVEIVTAARSWCGTPYLHQASLKGVGTDCLGLVRGIWREVIGDEPEALPAYQPVWTDVGDTEALAAAAGRHLQYVPPTDFMAGDVLLFRWRLYMPARHAGVACSAAAMIHAQERASVTEVALSAWWLRRLAFAFRFPGVTG